MKVKAVLVGDSGVGKTAIFKRLESNTFDDNYITTVGGAFTKIITTNNKNVEVEIGFWDTAGQERFNNIIPMYFQKADFVIAVYDVTTQLSFDNLSRWINIVHEKAPENTKIILVGNKVDKEDRIIDLDDAINVSNEYGAIGAFETSAKTGDGIDMLVNEIVNACSCGDDNSGDKVDDGASIKEVNTNPEEVDHQQRCIC